MINCTFKKTDVGFCVSNERRTIYIRPYQYGIIHSNTINASKNWHNWLPLYRYNVLLETVAQSMSEDARNYWYKVCDKKGIDKERYNYGPLKFHKWFANKTQRIIAKEFANHWNWMIKEKVNKKDREISKRLCAVLGLKTTKMDDDVYRLLINDQYLYNDFMKFPACVYALMHLNQYDCFLDDDIYGGSKFSTLKNKGWMYLYTYSDEVKRPLRKTLMNMPRGMYSDIVSNIKLIDVKQAIYGRTKIMMILRACEHNHQANTRVLEKATNEDILRVARMARYRGLPFNMRKVTNIISMTDYLLDYPDRYHGDIKGLFIRSYRWHQNPENIKTNINLPDSHEFPVPPWGELKSDAIKRITTVGEIKVEGKNMGHCVASYTEFCAKGQSFIYHVKYNKEAATVEVSPRGIVKQSFGPKNSKNKAASWGSREIQKLIKKTKWNCKAVVVPNYHNIDDGVPF